MPYWIGVVSREHIQRGVEGGFCQLCHGKAAAMRRLTPGDWIVFYSPKTSMHGGETLQAFTAIGRVKSGEPYAYDMGGGFVPTRRDVDFKPCQEAPIRPLVPRLGFIRNKQSWGYVFRHGQIEIPQADFTVIAGAMGIEITDIAA
ncbi:MAG: EVE domain-containing protein [Xanthobacteraceae bacterium]